MITKNRMKVRRIKKKKTNQQHAADIRKYVNQIKLDYQKLLPEGELVSEKYYTSSVGLILGKVKAKRKYTYGNMSDFTPLYAARHLYNYTIQVLWMNHQAVDAMHMDKITEYYCRDLKLRKEKKKV